MPKVGHVDEGALPSSGCQAGELGGGADAVSSGLQVLRAESYLHTLEPFPSGALYFGHDLLQFPLLVAQENSDTNQICLNLARFWLKCRF